MKATWAQSNFNAGEWSPLAYGRFDLEKYRNALSVCQNYVPTQQGGLTRRPGTRFVNHVKDSSYAPVLHRFEFSTSQAYILEFGDYYVRFFTNEGFLYTSGVAAYNAGTAYAVGDLVKQSGVVYYCKAATTGNAPPNSTYWHPQSAVPFGSGDSIYEIPTSYSKDEVADLGFTQSADTLYIVHPAHAPAKLQRAGATNWKLVDISFVDGPYGPLNTTSTKLDVRGGPTFSITASSANGINGGAGFLTSDIGRLIRVKLGSWRVFRITSIILPTDIRAVEVPLIGFEFASDAVVVATPTNGSILSIDVVDGGRQYYTPPTVTITATAGSGAVAQARVLNGAVSEVVMSATGTGYSGTVTVTFTRVTLPVTETPTWRLGLWTVDSGYPSCVTFHQDRLCFAGAAGYPMRIDASNTGDYENFGPSMSDGTVGDSNAMAFNLNSSTVNKVNWMLSDEWGLIAGTSGGEWAISPSSIQQALTSTNVNAKQLSNFGSADIEPQRVGKATLFVQRTGRKLRELFYQYTYNTFQVLDISLTGEHLTKGGLKQLAVQFAPIQIVWVSRNDGRLVALTYDRDQEVLGWHGHYLGGYSDAAQSIPPLVESVACIPAPSTQRDECWMVVNRYINGATVRTVEVMWKVWEDGDVVADAVFLDSSAAYSGAPTTTVSGLTHLVGQTVGVLADGAVRPDCLVSGSGTITLQRAASKVQVGLRYVSKAQTMTLEAGGADGPTQGKIKRIYKIFVRFFQSIGLNVGSSVDGGTAYPQPFRTSADPMGSAPGLFDGFKRWDYDGDWDPDGQLFFQTSDPLPSNITCLTAQVENADNT